MQDQEASQTPTKVPLLFASLSRSLQPDFLFPLQTTQQTGCQMVQVSGVAFGKKHYRGSGQIQNICPKLNLRFRRQRSLNLKL